jgi:kanamycin kinase
VIPEDLSDRYRDWRWEVAYHFNPGHPTYRLHRDGAQLFLKLHPTGSSIPDEAVRLRWAEEFLPVPRLIEYGSDGDYDWLLTGGLPGVDASRVTAEPRALVIALAEGMRAFHEAVPVRECPFDFTIASALDHVRGRSAAGLVYPAAADLLVTTAPAVEDPVVCHGDYSFPNVMLEGGKVTGYLDLGWLGVSDRWTDLAACARSCDFNLGPGHSELLFEAYGAPLDQDRLAWYHLLYDLR